MDLLTNNPIADMYGPHFLLLYGGVILVTLGICWTMLRTFTDSDSPRDALSGTHAGLGSEDTGLGIRLAGSLIILGLGGYKLVMALSKGRYNVLFLIAMAVGMAIGAAFLTPPDVSSMLFLLVPMALLYEIGLIAARFLEKERSGSARS